MALPKPITTVGVPPKRVHVIFVAKYRQTVTSSEVSTAIFLKHAAKQRAAALSAKPALRTYVFQIETLGDLRKSVIKDVKPGEVIERIDILAHGNERQVGLCGEVTSNNVLFDEIFTTFDETTVLVSMARWEAEGYAAGGKFLPKVFGWQDAVVVRLTDDATINVYACNSGGLDTNQAPPKTIDKEGELLQAIARLFDRPAVGFAGFLLWLMSPGIQANIYAFMMGIPLANLPSRADGRIGQSAKDLPFYRDLNGMQRADFPALVPLVIKRSP